MRDLIYIIDEAEKSKDEEIQVPLYDPQRNGVFHHGISHGMPQHFDRFEVEPAGRSSAHIVGIINGQKIRIATTTQEVAPALAAEFNKRGHTEVDKAKEAKKIGPQSSSPTQ